MSPQQLDRLREILSLALKVRPAGRDEFLAKECGGDEVLRKEVEALLSVHGSAHDFLSHSLPELLSVGSASRADLPTGTLLKDRYRIERRIAQSSLATVYLAVDELLGKMPVVVKSLDQLSDGNVLQELFASELQALSRVRHPNVVGIADVGTRDDGIPFLVLEFVPGMTLREVLREGPVQQPRARTILQEIARALAAAHRVEVWHLDIKPENMIVFAPDSNEERIKLIDFGIARLKSLNGVRTFVAGSPNYMAPEQEQNPSASCDIYALSLVAFELFTGHLPREGQEIGRQLPKELGKLTIQAIVRGLDPVPANRFTEVSHWLEDISAKPARADWKLFAVATAVLAVLAAILFSRSAVKPRPQPEYSKAIPVLASSAVERQPAFSPDGRELYVVVGRVGRRDIYKKALPYGEPEPIVTGPTDDEAPQVSPDGKKLAFIRRSEKSELIAMDLLTKHEELLARGTALDTYDTYSWAADSERIIVATAFNGSQIFQVVTVRTKSVQALNLPGASECTLEHPTLSPDGKVLAFACRWTQGSDDLFVSPINANIEPIGPARRVTHRKERVSYIQWSPDSRSLLYIAGPLGAGKMWRVDAFETASPTQVTSGSEPIEHHAVSRRHWKLAYSQDFSKASVWQYRLGSERPQQLITSKLGDEEGHLSPNGKNVLFVSARSGSLQAWVAEADGSSPRQLTNFSPAEYVLAIWSADSSSAIVTVRSKDVGHRIFSVPVSGQGTPTQLLEGGWAISVSRNGHWLYYTKLVGKVRSIWRTEYAKSLTTELIVEGGEYGMESPDGKSFYYCKNAAGGGIWKQPLPRGPAKQVVQALRWRNLFVVGKNGITYIGPVPGREFPALLFKRFDERVGPKMLFGFSNDIGWGLSLSPDGQTVVFSQDDVGNSDISLVEQFR